jgi:hypothetical protein
VHGFNMSKGFRVSRIILIFLKAGWRGMVLYPSMKIFSNNSYSSRSSLYRSLLFYPIKKAYYSRSPLQSALKDQFNLSW